MIYIFSECQDVTTDKVIEWLISLNTNYVRINTDDIGRYGYELSLINGVLNIKDFYLQKDWKLDKNSVVWFRRGGVNMRPKNYVYLMINDLKKYLQRESESISKSIDLILRDSCKKVMGSYYAEQESLKLYNLHIARAAGFKIPESIVTNNKKFLEEFGSENIITKAISKGVSLNNNGYSLGIGNPIKLSQDDIEKISVFTEPMLFQRLIPKDYELRVFVFDDLVFPMAILSSSELDYRNDYGKKPISYHPYKLPHEIEYKIHNFMKLSGLDTGSLDLIIRPDGECVFLEINPMGQLDWLSGNCNYNVEKKIALKLKQYHDV